jgi:hypothetical protein
MGGEDEPENKTCECAQDKGYDKAFPGIGRFFGDLLEQGRS